MNKRLKALLLIPTLFLFFATACAKESEPASLDTVEIPAAAETGESNVDAQTAADATEEGGDPTASIAWPSDIPADVPPIEDVTYTYATSSTQGLPTKTVHFEGGTLEKAKAYIAKLEAAGFIESSRNENAYGLDYTAQKGKLQVVINLVADGISHVSVIDTP